MAKMLIFIGLIIALQLADNKLECVAQSHSLNVQRTIGPVGGISVEHPLQATVYAYRRGKMKLLVPFEITVVPMGGLEPERPAPSGGYPMSGQVNYQPNVRYPPNYVYPQRQHDGAYYGSNYYPSVSYQYQTPYNVYYPYNNGYYNQQTAYRPFYVQPQQGAYVAKTKPFPQYRPPFQQNNVKSVPSNWSKNNTAININSLMNKTEHASNATTPKETTLNVTATKETAQSETPLNQTTPVQLTTTEPPKSLEPSIEAPQNNEQSANPNETSGTEPKIESRMDGGYIIPPNFASQLSPDIFSNQGIINGE